MTTEEFVFPGDRIVEKLAEIMGSKEQAEAYYDQHGYDTSVQYIKAYWLDKIAGKLRAE